ncbi:MAG: sugar ABC transporter permease [Deinococcota bacterium]
MATNSLQRLKRNDALAGYGFMTPALIVFLVFLFLPIFFAIFVSFTNWNGITPFRQEGAYEFVGFENYYNLLIKRGIRQKDFYNSLKNTVYYALGVVPFQTLFALMLAVLVNQKWLRGKGIFRTAFYFPSVSSSVVISLIFMWLFGKGGIVNIGLSALIPVYEPITWLDDSRGIIHELLGLFGITRATAGDWVNIRLATLTLWEWISGPSITLLLIMILNTWTTIGSLMIIYLAALQDIPEQMHEAAMIDGANRWQVFLKITVPMLTPATFFVVTLGLISTLQVFDQIFVITSGGPAKTTMTIAYGVYQSGFRNSDMGLAAASALVLFVIIFVLTLVQRRFVKESLYS